jgi:DNA-binding NtrC family response regulator
MLVQTSGGFRYQALSEVPVPAGDFSHLLKKSAIGRILVVDDEPLVRWSIAETLRAAGYEVAEAGDADSALHALIEDDHLPDALLLDLRLPDSSDLHLLETIKLILPATPVVLMTAFGTPELVAEARGLGAYAVLEKPFDLSALEPLLDAARTYSPGASHHHRPLAPGH